MQTFRTQLANFVDSAFKPTFNSTVSALRTASIKHTSLPTSSSGPSNPGERVNKLFMGISSALVFATLTFATPAHAESQCKGLANDQCVQNQACGWVEGYERKDGRTVKSFCRTSRKGISASVKASATDKELVSKVDSGSQ